MRYEEFSPAQALSRFVKCFWVLESASAQSPAPERILPDGCTEIVFHAGDAFEQYNVDGTSERQPLALLVGQMRGHLLIQPTGVVRVLGIRFWPGGAYPFVSVPQHEVTGQVLPLDSLWGRIGRELHSRIADAVDLADSVRVVEQLLLCRLYESKRVDDGLLKTTALILQSGGCVPVEMLAGHLGISLRKLDRMFNTRVGLTPKALCRVIRFQQVFKLLERGQRKRDWALIATECGYYDQAHFIKEFSAFAGQAPTSYFAGQNAMSDYFTASQ
ncbi:MAG TPA: helix-turn-helix transcriptional regulator [Blastocatellia bacterium]|nr:helix-turn-helix transcriptional regulator [Blastocatellia bacterium]